MTSTELRRLFFSFDGRISRARWWGGSLLLVFIGSVNTLINWTAVQEGGIGSTSTGFLEGITWIIAIALIWPILAVSVKRWHDRGRSGWWVLINLVPVFGSLWSFIELGFVAGTPGTNEHGGDPLDPFAGGVFLVERTRKENNSYVT